MIRHVLRLVLVLSALAALGATPHLPQPQQRTLANGLRVVLLERPGAGIVQVQLQVPAGLSAEPGARSGIASLTAQLLRQGTTSRTAAEMAAELDTLGASFVVNVTRDAAQVVAGARTAELESVLELVSDAVVNPRFDDESFQLARRQVAMQLGQMARTPSALADERIAALVFGPHPYGRALRGDLESLVGATREQAREFHRDHWRPDRAVLVIAGDVDAARAFASAAEWFERWGGRFVAPPAAPAPVARPGLWLQDLEGVPMAEVRIGLLTPGRSDPAFPAWLVAREALEGGRLPAAAAVTLNGSRDAGLLVVSASARPESVGVVVRRLRRSLESLASLSASDLAAARRRATGTWAFSLETAGQLSASWLAGDLAGQPATHLAAQRDAIAQVPFDGVVSAVRAGGVTLVAGPAARMKGRLAGLGPVDTVRVGGAADESGPSTPVTEEQRNAGRALVQAAVLAHGGLPRLKSVFVSEATHELQLLASGREVTAEVRTIRVDPDRFVQTTRILDLEQRQVLDGRRGWTLTTVGDSAQIADADSMVLSSWRGIRESDVVHLLRAAAAPEAAPFEAGKTRVADQAADRVEFRSPLGQRVRLSVDERTRRVVAVEAGPTPQGEWRDRRLWSAFVQLEGVWWPSEEVRELDGQVASRSRMRRLLVNGDVDTTLFRRPLVVRGQIRNLE